MLRVPDEYPVRDWWVSIPWIEGRHRWWPTGVCVIDPDLFRQDGRVTRVLRRHLWLRLWDVSAVVRGDCLMLVRLMPDETTCAAAALRLGVVLEHPCHKLVTVACDTFSQAAEIRHKVRLGMAIDLPDPPKPVRRPMPWEVIP